MSAIDSTRFSLKRTVEPAVLAVSIADVRRHSRIAILDDDPDIFIFIRAATTLAENKIRKAFITQTWRKKLDNWPLLKTHEYFREIPLERPPLISVTSIVYLDQNGNSQTWGSSNYLVNTDSEPGRIAPAEGLDFPAIQNVPFPISITYVAGYGSAPSAVPVNVRLWIAMAAAAFNEYRELEQEAALKRFGLGDELLMTESIGDLIVQ